MENLAEPIYSKWGWICDPKSGERLRRATKREHDFFEEHNPDGYCDGHDVLLIAGEKVSYEP